MTTSMPAWISTSEAAARLGISRTTLDAMVARAPSTLPGAPLAIGVGDKRRHLRWDETRLGEWVTAYGHWTAGQEEAPPTPRPAKMAKVPKAPSTARRQSLLSAVTGGRDGQPSRPPGGRGCS